MPKRKSEDELIKMYHNKIKKLKNRKKEVSRRRRVIVYSDSESDFETNEEMEITNNDEEINTGPLNIETVVETDNNMMTADEISPNQEQCLQSPTEQSNDQVTPQASFEAISELDPEIRLALGDAAEDIPVFGENIHADLAQRWLPILRKGLTKDVINTLLKEYKVPENCKLLKAPSLNPEIAAAVADVVRARDKKIETKQEQMGLGITAMSKALTILINDGKKVDIIKPLSEACRILCDLHYVETQTRTKLITPCLDKSFVHVVQDGERDDTLFGNKLSEKIKEAKTIEKQGLQIKRNAPVSTKSRSQQPSRVQQSGNWTNPPRYPSSTNRGGRGGSYTASRTPPGTSYRRCQNQVTSTQLPPSAPAGPQTRQLSARSRAPPRR